MVEAFGRNILDYFIFYIVFMIRGIVLFILVAFNILGLW